MVRCYWATGHYVGSESESPYIYSMSNGTEVMPQTIGGQADTVCYYPNATDNKLSEYGSSLPGGFGKWRSVFILLITFMIYTSFRRRTCTKRFKAKGRNWEEEVKNMGNKSQQIAAEGHHEVSAVDAGTPMSVSRMYGIFFLFVTVSILQTMIWIQSNRLSQGLLPTTSRNAQVMAESVLHPIRDIFSFLDDILLVKVSVALIAGDYKEIRRVFMLGVFAGAAMGVIGALCSTIVVQVPSLAESLFNPYGTPAVSSGCHLADNDDVAAAKAYFVTCAWSWPFGFAGCALSGFALGLESYGALCVIGVVSSFCYFLGIQFVFTQDPRLEVLGYVNAAGSILPTVLWSLYFFVRKDLRVKLGLTRQADQDGGLIANAGRRTAVRNFWSDPETKHAMKDGLSAMLVEMTVELGHTITLYAAARTIGVGGIYQISAHLAVSAETGLAIAGFLLDGFRMGGPRLLESGLHDQFLWLLEFVFAWSLIACVLCGLTVFTGSLDLMVSNGDQISIFASIEACLSDYSGYFGNDFSSFLSGTSFLSTVLSVPIFVFIRSFYRVAKSALYAMQDFIFMMKVTLTSFFLVFLPAVVMMYFTCESALVCVIVMNLPNLVCMVAFNLRLRYLTGKLDSNEGHKHNPVLTQKQNSLASYGIDPMTGVLASFKPQANTGMPEIKLSWGSTSDADQTTVGSDDNSGAVQLQLNSFDLAPYAA